MFGLVILITDKNRRNLNKNIKKINPKIKIGKDHIDLYLSWVVISNDPKRVKWMKDVSDIEDLLYSSLNDLLINFNIKVTESIFEFFRNYKDKIRTIRNEYLLHDFIGLKDHGLKDHGLKDHGLKDYSKRLKRTFTSPLGVHITYFDIDTYWEPLVSTSNGLY